MERETLTTAILANLLFPYITQKKWLGGGLKGRNSKLQIKQKHTKAAVHYRVTGYATTFGDTRSVPAEANQY